MVGNWSRTFGYHSVCAGTIMGKAMPIPRPISSPVSGSHITYQLPLWAVHVETGIRWCRPESEHPISGKQ